jgi:hypothetical protein
VIDDHQRAAGVVGRVAAGLGDEEYVQAVVLIAHSLAEVVGLEPQAGKARHVKV